MEALLIVVILIVIQLDYILQKNSFKSTMYDFNYAKIVIQCLIYRIVLLALSGAAALTFLMLACALPSFG